MKTYVTVYFGTALLAMFLVPIISRLAKRYFLVDDPGPRKVHQGFIPRIGGIAFVVPTFFLLLPLFFLDNRIGQAFRETRTELIVLLAAASFVFAVGLVDDLRSVPGRVKLLCIVAASLAVCASGATLSSFSVGTWFEVETGWAAWPLTVLWITIITVCMNFIDGLDGLAAGIAVMVCGVIAILAFLRNEAAMMVLMLALLGSVTGFLFFNFHPAKIFMGDCGSMFLGFVIGGSSIICQTKTSTLVGLALPFLVLGVPIFDMGFAMVRRRILERRSIFAPDRSHLHHRLLDIGLSQRTVVTVVYAITAISADPPLDRLRDSLSVRPRPRTEIIDVSFTYPSAKDAKLIVDGVLDQYMKYTAEKSDATEDSLYRQLVDQYKSLQNEIQGREKICAELHKSLGTETPQELISSKRLRIDQTQARLSDLQNTIAILEWEMKQTVPGDSNNVLAAESSGKEKQPKYYEDAEWRRLDLEVRNIEHQIATSVLGPNHPDAIRAKKDLEFAQESLQLREAQLDAQLRDRTQLTAVAPITSTATSGLGYEGGLMSVEQRLARAKTEEQLLQTELEKQQAEFKGLFESAQLLEKESNELRHKRELFDAVRERLDQKNMERNVPGSIEVLMRAYSPSRPEKDRRIVFTAMALFLGLGVGGGAAFLRASRNQTIYTPKDMPQPMQVPFLGFIPLIRTQKLPAGKSLLDEIKQNRILFTESVRVLRTALLSRLDGQGTTTVLITSAMAGTGKSSFTRALGTSMAQAGRKVLMIDADIQKMSLSRWFDLLDKPGFMDFLSSRSIDMQHIFPTETTGLSIMPAGTRGDGGVVFEEIANGAFKTCMDQLSKQYSYDIILLDGSPILPVADATILAGQVDGTILVERECMSRRASVAGAIARLASVGGHLLGTVFVGSGGLEEYGYSYGYYHYHDGAKKP